MKVKIGDKVYDSTKEPIMLILSEADKANISNMPISDRYPNHRKYCSFPKGMDRKIIEEFMGIKK